MQSAPTPHAVFPCDLRTVFRTAAADYGFLQVFFTTPRKFDLGRNRFNLTADAPKEYPWANSIAVLVYPYAPFTAEERIPAYYIASNRAYHSAKKLAESLNAAGIRAEKTDIPVKMQLEAEGIGIKCRNSLIALPEFGTRIVLLTFVIREIPPETLSELLTVFPALNTQQSECGNCSLCMKACPTGAISENGLTTERCMRLQMETAQHPDSVRAMQKTFIGCEICQYACPRNAKIPPADTKSFRTASGDEINLNDVFNLKRLITGDAAQARGLVGRNFTGNGKLTAEAIAFAANDAELFLALHDEIFAAADSPFAAVRDAVRYAAEVEKERDSRF
ncbi:MAG TPA: hypothetical protein DCY17_02025 [Clostridiales bacterium]|nr:hypothetical protein [Clostridiales bacterium]